MIRQPQHKLAHVEMSQCVPAGLSSPVPAHHARSRSSRNPCYASRTIKRAALGTATDIPGHS
jgi:hypothetical protein